MNAYMVTAELFLFTLHYQVLFEKHEFNFSFQWAFSLGESNMEKCFPFVPFCILVE